MNSIYVAPLIDSIDFDALAGDKAFNANRFAGELGQRGAKMVISQRRNRLSPLAIDAEMYKRRRLIEKSCANPGNSNTSPCMQAEPARAFAQ
ncbi:hypothetical protein RM533_08175 [Croceicoccus sp. F390]|uniref:Transposase IS4-like domain-containing protein n=1 Tax=Croceicoccus esteveae TaxID=3075597 RepID=A0ABU2ZHS3_9SPHN|nr:hypothetical protein [Croceicoccus sp. F390]MDT0576163.1 hypothetical protein [Croceicoccus sp. F390]